MIETLGRWRHGIKIYKCQRCNEPLEEYSISTKGEMLSIGYVCMKEGCDRYGLLAVTAKMMEVTE